jgi:hypothetical protein
MVSQFFVLFLLFKTEGIVCGFSLSFLSFSQ